MCSESRQWHHMDTHRSGQLWRRMKAFVRADQARAGAPWTLRASSSPRANTSPHAHPPACARLGSRTSHERCTRAGRNDPCPECAQHSSRTQHARCTAEAHPRRSPQHTCTCHRLRAGRACPEAGSSSSLSQCGTPAKSAPINQQRCPSTSTSSASQPISRGRCCYGSRCGSIGGAPPQSPASQHDATGPSPAAQSWRLPRARTGYGHVSCGGNPAAEELCRGTCRGPRLPALHMPFSLGACSRAPHLSSAKTSY